MDTEIAIIGGGPAGAAAAITLRNHQHEVMLLERSNYESWRIGELLPSVTQRSLESLGVWVDLDQRLIKPCAAVKSFWGSDSPFEANSIFDPYGGPWHIDRRKFDAALAGQAKKRGARLKTLASVGKVQRSSTGWILELSGQEFVRSKILIDATGRSAQIARTIGARRIAYDNLVCRAGKFEQVGNSALNDNYLLLEAARTGWWYSTPVPKGELVVAHLTDGDFLKAANRDPKNSWFQLLNRNKHTSARLSAGRRVRKFRSWNAGTHRLDRVTGMGWLAVGDAAASRDPLSGDGIFRAIDSGIRAANAVHLTLNGNARAFKDYEKRVFIEFEEYLRTRARYYSQERRWQNDLFWQRRQPPNPSDLPIALNPLTRISKGPDLFSLSDLGSFLGLLPVSEWLRLHRLCQTPRLANEVVRDFVKGSKLQITDRTAIVALESALRAGLLRSLPPPP